MTIDELREFESNVVVEFEAGHIRGPVHLSHGDEESLIEIFKEIEPQDWVFSTWRNHYHALLHGVSKDWLFSEILAGRSINIHCPEHNLFTSAIVGGIIPIATGVAFGLKKKKSDRKVWCFIGDMAYSLGIFYESLKYAQINDLPITFVCADNGISTNTPTLQSWGFSEQSEPEVTSEILKMKKVWYFRYKRHYPHVGVGKKIHF
jgi:TPP-dependent pyruvate/acetoin dehydrogenase alpha subunit